MPNQVIERKPNGQFAKGASGNLGGNAQHLRHLVNKAFLQDMAKAWQKHGMKALEKCAKNQPAAFCKMYVLLVPREMKVEQTGGVASLTDEQLEQAIAAIKAMLAARTGEEAKVIDGTAEPAALPAPTGEQLRRKRQNRLLEHVDTAVGPTASEQVPARRRNNEIPAKGAPE
jgi:hypothetical protein